jgi:hypothetical protein
VSRGHRRPKADLIPSGVRDLIPPFPLPLRRGEDEPAVDAGTVLHALYDRAGYDLRIQYEKDPVPPLAPENEDWVKPSFASAERGRRDSRLWRGKVDWRRGA